MEELSLKEIQSLQLNMLKKFDNLCCANGLRYSLGGGTLLGAVRHQGFIPWDDDIDVMMPRPDYNRLLSICAKHTDINVIAYELDSHYYNLFAIMVDDSTVVEDSISKVYTKQHGISIDIFPIDGLGNSKIIATLTYLSTELSREILIASNWKHFRLSKTHAKWIEPLRLILFYISRLVDRRRLIEYIDNRITRNSFDCCKYAGCISGSYRLKEIMLRSTFEQYTKIDFENAKFNIISNYEKYLKQHYGDYLVLPDKDSQQSHHTYKAFKR